MLALKNIMVCIFVMPQRLGTIATTFQVYGQYSDGISSGKQYGHGGDEHANEQRTNCLVEYGHCEADGGDRVRHLPLRLRGYEANT